MFDKIDANDDGAIVKAERDAYLMKMMDLMQEGKRDECKCGGLKQQHILNSNVAGPVRTQRKWNITELGKCKE
jgi:hypothetical protein